MRTMQSSRPLKRQSPARRPARNFPAGVGAQGTGSQIPAEGYVGKRNTVGVWTWQDGSYLVKSCTHLYFRNRSMTQGIFPTSSRQVQA